MRNLFQRLLRHREFAAFVGYAARAPRGAVMVEYALLLVAVGIPAVAGLTAGGVTMLESYQLARDAMLSPFP